MKKTFIFCLLYTIANSLNAQTTKYSYDSNGNITSRTTLLQVVDKFDKEESELTKDLILDVEIKQDKQNDKIIVYVNGNKNEEVDVQLYDTSARLINKESSNKTKHELDCSTIPDGIYIIDVRCAGNVYSQKIIKE